MSKYVYPVYEAIRGTYYGAHTSVKGVDERIKDLVKYRKDRAKAIDAKIDVNENRFSMDHPNDRLLSVFIKVVYECGKEENEQFVVHRSKIS